MHSVSYIVRIYRFKKNDPRSLVGVVEEAGVKGKRAFTNYDELWEILISSKNIQRHEKQRGPAATEYKQKKEKGGDDENN